MLRFLPVALSNYKLLLKNLFHFTEQQDCRMRSAKKGFPNGLPVVDLLDLLNTVDVTIHPYTYLDDASLIPDVVLLKSLAKKIPSCDYLEIGSWRGESLMNVVEHVNTCTSISLSDQQMREMGFSEKQIALNGFFSKRNPKINHIGANSQTFDFSSLGWKFDLIFVDGDHHYQSVVNDTKNVFKLLKDENSIIIWHDYGYSYESIRWEVVDAILEGTPKEERKNLYKVSNTYCAIYSKKPLPSKLQEFPATPDKLFTVTVKADRI